MKYQDQSKQLIELLGGKENVTALVHCATRLRFKLKDTAKANTEKISALQDVLTVVNSGGQYQVVIGSKVADYYDTIMKMVGLKEDQSEAAGEKVSPVSRVFEVISGAFSPLIPLIAGSGMVKALLTILVTVGWLAETSSSYLVISAASNAVFYFLPIFLGVTLAKKMGADQFVGGAIGAALLEPGFTGLIGTTGVNFLGIKLIPVDYASSVFPIFIAIIIYSYLYKGLKKIIQKDLQLFLLPMTCLIIMVPLTAIVFGPMGTNVGNIIANVIIWLFEKNKLIAGAVVGGGYPFFIMLGLHWGFTPITLQNLANYGGDILEGAAVACVWAQTGVAIGLFLRAKAHSKERAMAGPSIMTGIFAGVTEPILYGIVLRYRRTIPVLAISGTLGGAVCGMFGVTMNAYVFHNIFSMPVYSPFMGYLLGIGTAILAAAILTYLFGFTKEELAQLNQKQPEIVELPVEDVYVELNVPAQGKQIMLENIDDEVFASGVLGKGIAVEPSKGEVYAPTDATVVTVFPTKHAIGLKTDAGIECLIHIGLNTVALNGEHFESFVKDGDRVKKGTLLTKFDIDAIEQKGYSLVTAMVIVESDQLSDVMIEQNELVSKDTVAIKVVL